MSDQDNVAEILEKVKPDFIFSAKEAMESMFGVEGSIKEDWAIVERLEGNYENVFSIGNANNDYQAILIVSIQDNTVKKILNEAGSGYELLDAFGELGNNFCGVLMDQKNFTDEFGILTQSVPQYSQGNLFVPKATGVCGKVYFDNSDWMHFGYAIRKMFKGI